MSYSLGVYRDFKKRLGSTGALLELNHLAIAELIAAAKGVEHSQKYVETRAKAHGIHVHSSAFAEMSARLSQMHIVVLYEEWEHFLSDFRKEFCSVSGEKWPQKKDGEEPLSYVLRAIGAANFGADALGRFRLALMEYFRLARNCAVHPVNEKYEDYFERARAGIDENSEQILSYYGALPSEFVCFGFSDLVLCSRVLKDVALLLCRLIRSDENAVKHVIALKRFNKIKNNKMRLRNALLGELCTRYGLDREEAVLVLAGMAD